MGSISNKLGEMRCLGNFYLFGNDVKPNTLSFLMLLAQTLYAVGDLSNEDIKKCGGNFEEIRYWKSGLNRYFAS